MSNKKYEIELFEDYIKLNYLYKHNSEIHEIIPKLWHRYYEHIAKTLILNFYFEFLNYFNKIAFEIQYEDDDIEFYLKYIDEYFDQLNENLVIYNIKDIEDLSTILKISQIFLEESDEQNNMDCLFQSIFQLESKINKKKFMNNLVEDLSESEYRIIKPNTFSMEW